MPPLEICNGRKLGDTHGDFTCHKWNGKSVVDYCLASPGIYSKVLFLKVSNFLPLLSDHCPLLTAVKCNFTRDPKCNDNYEFITKPQKLNWDNKIALKFENLIQSEESKLFINNFAKNGIEPDQNSVDCTTEF